MMYFSKRRDFPFPSSRRRPFRLLFLLLFLTFLLTNLPLRAVAAPLREPANASGRETEAADEDVSRDRSAAPMYHADGGNSHPVTDGKTGNTGKDVSCDRPAVSLSPADGGEIRPVTDVKTEATGENISRVRSAASLSPADGGNSRPVTDGETGNVGEDVSCDRPAVSLSLADGGNSHPVTDGETGNVGEKVSRDRHAVSLSPADGGGNSRSVTDGETENTGEDVSRDRPDAPLYPADGGKTRPALSGSSQEKEDPALPTVTLPEEVAELLPEGADPDALLRLDLSYFLTFLLRQGGALLLPALRQLAALCAMLLLFSLLHKAGECGLFSSGLQSVLRLLLLSAAVLTVYPLLLREFTAVKEFFTMLSGFLSGFIPTMEMLYIAGGSGVTATVGGTGLSMTCAALDLVGQAWLLPLLRICLAMYLISAFLPHGELAPAADLAGRFFLLLCALFMAALLAVFSFQTFLASSADGAGARALRFTAGRFIPIVGSSVSEAMKTMLSSLKLMKSAAGAAGIAVVLLTALPLLLRQLLLKLTLQAGALLARLLGIEEGSKCLLGGSRLVDYTAALTAMFSVSAIFQMAVFMGTVLGLAG